MGLSFFGWRGECLGNIISIVYRRRVFGTFNGGEGGIPWNKYIGRVLGAFVFFGWGGGG